MPSDELSFLGGPAERVAARLLGCELWREVNGEQLAGRIVEVEAYDQSEPASHSYRGRTARTDVMFGPSGFCYVYFTYGMHFCMNVVTGQAGHGSAVLVRGLEPLRGETAMRRNRGDRSDLTLTNGPAKVCQALAIDATFNGHDLHEIPLRLVVRPPLEPAAIGRSSRIGISKARELPWRFYVRGNAYVSRP